MHSNAFTDWSSVELLTRSEGNQLGDVSANNANVVASYFEVLNVLNISNFELKVRSSHLEGFVGSTFSFVAQSKPFGEPRSAKAAPGDLRRRKRRAVCCSAHL